MTRPHPTLLDLVAGRGLVDVVEVELVQNAVEHRVAGLLKSCVDDGTPATSEASAMLERLDHATWARNRSIAEAVSEIAAIAATLEIDVAFIKGVVSEARWYRRLGERPTWDVDLVVAPWHRHRVDDLVQVLQPTHSMLPFLRTILERDRLQSIDLGYKGLPVDLHLDPLKLELADTRYPERFFAGVEAVALGDGFVPVFDPTVSLLVTAVALNKDRFRYLVGHADFLRIERDPGVDLARCERLARDEGLLGPFMSTRAAVHADIGTAGEGRRGDLQRWTWDLIWGPSVRLLGAEGKVRFRYRQSLIPMFDLRRWPGVAAAWWRRLLPSSPLLNRIYPGVPGPYFVRLMIGRTRRRLERRRQRRALRPVG